jgi:hypothetical protein
VSGNTDVVERYFAEVSNEPDPDRRRAAVDELFTEELVYTDDDGEVRGREAFAARITELAGMMPPGAAFASVRPAQEVGGLVLHHWGLGPAGGAPTLTGTDAVLVDAGRITRIWAVTDA